VAHCVGGSSSGLLPSTPFCVSAAFAPEKPNPALPGISHPGVAQAYHPPVFNGEAPPKEEQLARAQGVPLTLVESLMNDLVTAKMIVRGDDPKGLVLAQAPENIAVVEVLRVVQHQPHGGPQAFAVGTDNISQVLMRRDAAVEAALGGLTLRNLIRDPPPASEMDAAWEPPPEMNLDPAPRSESVRDIPGNPDSLQKKIQADLPAEGH